MSDTSRERRGTAEKGRHDGAPGTAVGLLVLLLASVAAAAVLDPRAAVAGQGHPARIVCLVPAVTEMLFAIGAGPQLAAVSSFDQFPPEVEKLPRVGALLDPDLERILSLRPDLVVTYGSQAELRQQLDRARVPQFAYTHGGLRDVTQTIRDVAARTGREDDGERLAGSIEAAIDAIRRRTAGRPAPRTLLVIAREAGTLRGIIASGGIGFLHDMLEAAGGTNAFADVGRESVQATSELVLARRPEVILEIRGSPIPAERARAEASVWRALASMPAVRNGRVHVLGDARTVVPGPRVAQGVELIARTLHPAAFE